MMAREAFLCSPHPVAGCDSHSLAALRDGIRYHDAGRSAKRLCSGSKPGHRSAAQLVRIPVRPMAAHDNGTRLACTERDEVWNLAIGSNMSVEKLKSRHPDGRKPIEPLLPPVPAAVADWSLSFDFEFIPPIEPVMAAAVPRTGCTLHGILYKLTKEDYKTLCMSEGCTAPTSRYVEAEVIAVPYKEHASNPSVPSKVVATVFALRDPPKKAMLELRHYPSKRYLQLMINASREVALSEDYISSLETHPVARPAPTWLKGLYQFHVIGSFFLYRSNRLMLMIRHYYRPWMRQAHFLRERASDNAPSVPYFLASLYLAITMVPIAIIGVFRALYQRRNVWKLARGIRN